MAKIDRVWFRQWQKKIIEKIGEYKNEETHIELILKLNETAKWLISELAHARIVFKVVNLGAGVKKITTDIENCPSCKKKLKED